MRTVGIDTGINGGFGVLDDGGRFIAAGALPIAGEGAAKMISPALMADLIRRFAPDIVVIERVASRPGEGVSSAFRFGKAAGILEGVVGALGVRSLLVTPSTWKRGLSLGADKETSRARALELWPEAAVALRRKADHNAAEALLLALWGRKAAIAGGLSDER